jgi:molybdenum cofactor cytidylyltransferase
MCKIAVIILAAGASTRLGQPKQLLPYSGKTLIRHAAETALKTRYEPVIVVTGALHEQLLVELKEGSIEVIHNPNWQQGMSASIRTGVEAAEKQEPDAVLIMLCDQPLITSEHLKALGTTFSSLEDGSIVATGYEHIAGVPALFPKKLFNSLKALQGEQGARELLKVHQNSLVTVSFAGAAVDIDTPEDYENL